MRYRAELKRESRSLKEGQIENEDQCEAMITQIR